VTVALKVRLAGEAPKVAAAALPVSATVAGANTPDGLLLTLREPVKPLPTVCDENVTCTLQLLPSASTNGSAGQLPPPLSANRGVVASAVTLIAAPLTLLRVTGCDALVAVTVALKLKLLGDRLAPPPAHAGSANAVSSAGNKPWPIFHRIRPCRMACSAVISAEVTRRVQQSSRGWRNSGEQCDRSPTSRAGSVRPAPTGRDTLATRQIALRMQAQSIDPTRGQSVSFQPRWLCEWVKA